MTISDEVETKAITAYYARRTEFLAPLAASPGHVEQATITCANEAGVRAAIEAAVEAEREECAKIAEIAVTHFHSDRIKIATAIRNRKSGARE